LHGCSTEPPNTVNCAAIRAQRFRWLAAPTRFTEASVVTMISTPLPQPAITLHD